MIRNIILGLSVVIVAIGLGVLGHKITGAGQPVLWVAAVLGGLLAVVLATRERSKREVAFTREYGRFIYGTLLVAVTLVVIACLCVAVYKTVESGEPSAWAGPVFGALAAGWAFRRSMRTNQA